MIDQQFIQQLLEMQDQSKATITATVVADSVNDMGNRLTTFNLVFPRQILPEVLTHRVASRNTASSRAIPVRMSIESVVKSPFIPIKWGMNKAGMQATEELPPYLVPQAIIDHLQGRDWAVETAKRMNDLGLHKQIVNRYLEPWAWCQMVFTTTSFDHMIALRDSAMAEPHFQYLAQQMVSARSRSVPKRLECGEWHLPFITPEDATQLNMDDLKRVSTARCAAVSYVRQNERSGYEKEFSLCDRLIAGGHWSPLEHLATPMSDGDYYFNPKQEGNFSGWKQYRKLFKSEFKPDTLYTGPTA